MCVCVCVCVSVYHTAVLKPGYWATAALRAVLHMLIIKVWITAVKRFHCTSTIPLQPQHQQTDTGLEYSWDPTVFLGGERQ